MKQYVPGKQAGRNNKKIIIQSRENASCITSILSNGAITSPAPDNKYQLNGKFYNVWEIESLFICVEDYFDQPMLFGPPCAGCAVEGSATIL